MKKERELSCVQGGEGGGYVHWGCSGQVPESLPPGFVTIVLWCTRLH